jgi:hypothetical protein
MGGNFKEFIAITSQREAFADAKVTGDTRMILTP